MTTAQPPTSTDRPARRRLSWRRKVAYLTAIWFIALLLLELALRVVQPQFVTFVGDFLAVHEYVRWHNTDLRPNVSRRLRLSTSNNLSLLDMTITTDQLGLRTNDPIAHTHTIPSVDASGSRPTKTIHCIGDSYTMGWGVESEQAYPAQLARLLGSDYFVLNLGVDGFGLLASVTKGELLERESSPDVVIYAFCENDFEDDDQTLEIRSRGRVHHSLCLAANSLLSHCYVARTPIAAVFWAAFRNTPQAPDSYCLPDGTTVDQLLDNAKQLAPAENATTRALAALQADCREHHRDLIVVLLTANSSVPLAMYQACRQMNIDPVVFPVYRRRMLPRDSHLGPVGNADLAAVLAQRIQGD